MLGYCPSPQLIDSTRKAKLDEQALSVPCGLLCLHHGQEGRQGPPGYRRGTTEAAKSSTWSLLTFQDLVRQVDDVLSKPAFLLE